MWRVPWSGAHCHSGVLPVGVGASVASFHTLLHPDTPCNELVHHAETAGGF